MRTIRGVFLVGLLGCAGVANAVPLTFDFTSSVELTVDNFGTDPAPIAGGMQILSGSFTIETEAPSFTIPTGELVWLSPSIARPAREQITGFSSGSGLLSFSFSLGGYTFDQSTLTSASLGFLPANLYLFGEDITNPTGMWSQSVLTEAPNGQATVGMWTCGLDCYPTSLVDLQLYWPQVIASGFATDLTVTLRATSVPEPSSLALFAMCVLGVGVTRRRAMR